MTDRDFAQRKIVILDTVEENRVLDFFQNYPILPSAEIFFFFTANDNEIFVKQIYRVAEDFPLIEEIYGKYSTKNDTFVDLRSHPVTSRRRRNLMGAQLNASLVVTHNDTLQHLHDYQLSWIN